jgi:hypothetical protein
MKKVIFIIFITGLFASCSKFNVRNVNTVLEHSKKSGFYYNLPKTSVGIEVSVNKVYKIKGPYSSYALKYLGLTSVITANSTYYEINNIKINSCPVPDSENYYFIETGNGSANKAAIMLQLLESGFLVSANDKGIELNEQSSDAEGNSSVSYIEDINSYFSVNSNLTEKIDTVIEKVNLDTTTIEKKVLRKVVVEKTLEQKAKEAADFIMSVKEAKFNLLNGLAEVAYSKEAISYMVEELSKTETEYLNLFTGITVTQTYSTNYTYCPSASEAMSDIVLCRFSPSEGLLDTTRFIGKDITIKFSRSADTKGISENILQNVNLKQKTHGFFYRIPEYAEVSVNVGETLKAKTRLLINQFGVIAEMPYSKGMQLNFYPKTGALKMVKSN